MCHLQNPLQYYFVCQDIELKLLESIVPQACFNLIKIATSGPDVDSNFSSSRQYSAGWCGFHVVVENV